MTSGQVRVGRIFDVTTKSNNYAASQVSENPLKCAFDFTRNQCRDNFLTGRNVWFFWAAPGMREFCSVCGEGRCGGENGGKWEGDDGSILGNVIAV